MRTLCCAGEKLFFDPLPVAVITVPPPEQSVTQSAVETLWVRCKGRRTGGGVHGELNVGALGERTLVEGRSNKLRGGFAGDGSTGIVDSGVLGLGDGLS